MLATNQIRIFLFSCLLSKSVMIKVYKTIILPIVSCGYEAGSLTLREEYRLRKLRIIFGPVRVEVAGDWRRLHNEELHNLDTSPNTVSVVKSKGMGWDGHSMLHT
jgi:hypothetical protein